MTEKPRSRSWLSITAAARLLGVSRPAVYHQIERRKLRTTNAYGGRTLVSVASLNAWQKRREAKGVTSGTTD